MIKYLNYRSYIALWVIPTALLIQIIMPLMQMTSVFATPTFTDFPISSSYKMPDAMTVASGDLWYLQRTSSSNKIDAIGRMTTAGTTTDYSLNFPTGNYISEVKPTLLTGSDGNVWFYGTVDATMRLGKLDVASGNITYYSPGCSDLLANIGNGPDGKIYFACKAGNTSYLKYFDLTTATSGLLKTFDTYSSIGNLIAGPDGKLYFSNGYYKYIRNISVTDGSLGSSFSTGSTAASRVIFGPDNNLWFVRPDSKIAKINTTSGVLTDFDVSSSATVNTSTKLVNGPDGALWFYNAGTTTDPKVGRITTSGSVNTYELPVNGAISDPYGGPVVGPDGAIWVNYHVGSSNTSKLVRFGY